MVRSWPNIALTGTPGTGKSTHAQLLVEALPVLRHVNIGDVVKEHAFHEGFDEAYQTYDVDEDALLDYIEPLTGKVAPEPVDDDDDDGGGEQRQQEEGAGSSDAPSYARTGQAARSDDTGDDRGGLVLDWHSCDAYPERWVDLVVVLRCNHELLWKRLAKRNYPLAKIQDNNEAEIMETVLAEARDAYPAEAIVELKSESNDDVDSNVARVIEWVHAWRAARGFPASLPSPLS